MASRGKGAKVRGDVWERDLVKFAAELGIPLERRKAGFHQDMGDLMGLHGFMVEAKAAAVAKLGESMDKTLVSWRNSGQRFPVMFQKRPNASTRDGYAVMPIQEFLLLWREINRAGLLPALPPGEPTGRRDPD